MERIVTLIAIIGGAGIAGGLGAYLADPHSSKRDSGSWRHLLVKSLVLGLLAAACVPLFLSLVKSGLVNDIFRVPDAEKGTVPVPPYEAYLVFTGLCLIGALYARRFLESVSRQLLQRIDSIDEKTDHTNRRVDLTEQKAEKAVNTAETAADLVDERDSAPLPPSSRPADVPPDLPPGTQVPELTDDQRRALENLKKYNFRTATGVASDIHVPRSQIGELLDELGAKGLVSRETSPATGGRRWAISPIGLAALRRSSE